MPNIKGFAACWGITVIHCPYCHGYEVKGEKTGILANGDMAFHYAQMIQHWTKELTVFTNGRSTITTEQKAKLASYDIGIIEKKVESLAHQNGHLRQIVFDDNTTFELKAIYARPHFEQHCQIPQMLGCDMDEQGYIKVDAMQNTSVEGVFACGDCTTPFRSVANAVAGGNIAGAILNKKMIETTF